MNDTYSLYIRNAQTGAEQFKKLLAETTPVYVSLDIPRVNTDETDDQ